MDKLDKKEMEILEKGAIDTMSTWFHKFAEKYGLDPHPLFLIIEFNKMVELNGNFCDTLQMNSKALKEAFELGFLTEDDRGKWKWLEDNEKVSE